MQFSCHLDEKDDVSFSLIDQPTTEPFISLRVGELNIYARAPMLAALRAACGEGLIDLKNAQDARPVTLTEHEDGHSLRADQHDAENAA